MRLQHGGHVLGGSLEGTPLSNERPTAGSRRPRSGRAPVHAVVAVIIAAVVILGYLAVSVLKVPTPGAPSSPGPLFSLRYDFLSRGDAPVLLPLSMLYTPANEPANVTFTPMASFGWDGGGTNLTFRWTNVTGSPLPVRFALSSAAGGALPGPWDGFVLRLAGEKFFTSWPNFTGLMADTAIANYTVWKVTPFSPFGGLAWIEVRYQITGFVTHPGFLSFDMSSLPSIPFPAVGDPREVTVGPNSTHPNGYVISTDTLDLPATRFGCTLPAITFDAGPLGHIDASLTSSFHWGNGSSFSLTITSPVDRSFTLGLYLDPRFGSLVPVVLG